jgi:purine-nucleoside phosphorylase
MVAAAHPDPMAESMPYFDQVRSAADAIQARVRDVPAAAIVLGSGLGDFAAGLADGVSMPYDSLPHWPASRVVGHEGRLVIGTVRGRLVAALSGRCHAYEGHDLRAVTFGIRVLGLLGIKILVLTNAAGAVNDRLEAGALMIIDDHLNLMGVNPLVGPNDDRFGPRFPDMSEIYTPRLRRIAGDSGRELGLALPHGIYAALLGPSYETPAEIRYLRTIGADAVGMSTVPEAIVARQMGLEVLGISCIANMAAGVLPQPLDHGEVLATTARVQRQFVALLEGIIARL